MRAPGPLPLFHMAVPIMLSLGAALLSSCNAALPSQPAASQPANPTPAAPNPSQAAPVITWPQPAPITYPAPLTSAQLDATANVPGTFVYSPAAGTVLPAGMQTLTATFTPTDMADYTNATASVSIVVNAAAAPAPVVISGVAVADSGDNRILIYNAPLSAGEGASIVIGQTSFTQGLANQGLATPSAGTLNTPTGLAMDSSGDLWVADDHNCRVLEFQPPFTTGMSASLVIGQPYLGAPPYCGAGGLFVFNSSYFVGSIAFDSQGDLWVSNGAAGRVLEYVPPFSDEMEPSLAIGQPNLEDSAPCNGWEYGAHGPLLSPTAATLCGPGGIAFDPQGDLWVTDEGNVRLLEFVPPFSTGMAASLEMIGQPPIAFDPIDETSCIDTSANNFCVPDSVAFDNNGDLWVADLQFQRVLEFAPPFSNGMNASAVIGQPNFADYGPWNPGAAGEPAEVSFDISGNFMVSGNVPSTEYEDPYSAGRIVVYSPPLNSGMEPATIMTSGSGYDCPTSSITAATLCSPVGLATF